MNYLTYAREEREYHSRFARYNRRKKAFLKWYFKLYHRLEVRGLDNIPEGPALIVPNHSGGFDLDIMAIMFFAHPSREISVLIAREWHFIESTWGRYFVGGGIPLRLRGGIQYDYIDPWLVKGGARFPGLVCIFPEGGSGTVWNRGKLKPFYPGVVRLALRYQVPIVPVAMIGFDLASPIVMEIARDHRTPDVVMPPFTLPVKTRIEFGRPFELESLYGRELGRKDEFRIANEIVRPRVAEVIHRHRAVSLVPWDGGQSR